MPVAEFYADLENQNAFETWIPKESELKNFSEDKKEMTMMANYKSRYLPQMIRCAKAWNMFSDPVSDDRVSNVFIGIARMLASTSIAAMSEGRPMFELRPGAASDYAKTDLWKAAMDMVLSESNFEAQQNTFLIDYNVLGTGVYEVYVQNPMKTIREETDGGGFSERLTRDYNRPRIGVRARSPFEVWIHPSARTIEESPSCYFQDNMTYDAFVQDYMRVIGKYKNTKCVAPGKYYDFAVDGTLEFREAERSGVTVITYQNQIKDVLRLYANGVLIFDAPLSKANILGITTLCFGTNNDQFDPNLQTHALYGMGDPYLVRGLDALYQAFANMTVDNWKLANSVAISYKPYGTSYLDLDNVDFYSGTMIDGEVVTSPLGNVDLSKYSQFKEILDEWCIWLTGTNFKQLAGETSKTAFELSQRIKAQNRRFEYKIRQLENGCFVKLGRLLLANVMSDMTLEDMEAVTEEQAEYIKDALKEGRMTGEDFTEENGKITQRKVRYQIRVPGRVFREDFSKSKKRKLNSNSTDNTLIEDVSMRGQRDSFVPAIKEYLQSEEYILHNGIPDIFVDGQHMLGDLQMERKTKMQELAQYAQGRVQEQVQSQGAIKTNFDMEKVDDEMVRAIGVDEDKVMMTSDKPKQNPFLATMEKIKQITATPPPVPPNSNAVLPTPIQSGANAGASPIPREPQQSPAQSVA